MAHVLFVGGGDPSKLSAYRTCIRKGYRITVIDQGESHNTRLANEVLFFNPRDLTEQNVEKIWRAVKKTNDDHKIQAIIPLSEFTVELSAELNERLQLKGLRYCVSKYARNKFIMRQQFKKFGLFTPNFKMVATEEEAIYEAEDIGYPCILKPIDYAGSAGVSRCTNPEEIKRAFQLAKAFRRDSPVIIESYISGKEISIEAVLSEGEICFFSITEKFKLEGDSFIEMGHISPYTLPLDKVELIKKTTEMAVRAIGLRDGATHTEIIFDDEKVFVVEIGARLGGDYIPDLVELAHGVNLYELWIESIVEKLDAISYFIPEKYAAIQFVFCDKGKVLSISEIESISKVSGVSIIDANNYFQIGQLVPVFNSNFDRGPFMMIQSKSREKLINQMNVIKDEFKIQV